jgi:hypothetical protein
VDNRNGPPTSSANVDQRQDERLEYDRRWRAIIQHATEADPARELTSYLLSRPWVEPRVLMGALVNREPHHIARLRELLEADLAMVTRCLSTLAALEPLEA